MRVSLCFFCFEEEKFNENISFFFALIRSDTQPSTIDDELEIFARLYR